MLLIEGMRCVHVIRDAIEVLRECIERLRQ